MDGGRLTFQEFLKLPKEEHSVRYDELSEHDKFGVRQTMDTGVISPPCNDCVYYRGYARCDAFPDGIESAHIGAIEKDTSTPCGESHHFVKTDEVMRVWGPMEE